MRVTRSNGFTLFEILVAMTVMGVAVMSAGTLLRGLLGRERQVNERAEAANFAANGRRTLAELLAAVDAGETGKRPVEGGRRHLQVRTWCISTSGWPVRCDAVFGVDSVTSSDRLVARIASASGAVAMPPLVTADRVEFRYLRQSDVESRWDSTWTELAPPVAVAVIAGGDTLVLVVGVGG